MSIQKAVSIFLIFTIIFSQVPLGSLAAEPIVLSDEFSQVHTNPDLSQTVEVYPFSLFKQDPTTLKWKKNQNVEVVSGAISYVSEAEPENNLSLANEVKAGSDANGLFETFIKFGNSLPSLNGGLFLGAKFRLKELNNDYDCYDCQYYYNQEFSIHKIQEPWTANNLNWENKPDLFENPVTSKTLAMPVGGGYYTWDVSDLVLDWYKNPKNNYGLALKAAGAESNPSVRTFTKLNDNLIQMPVLQIQYSPKPNAPSGIASGLQANSGKGMVNLQWYSVTGAIGYKVYLYNGKEFEEVYDGPETKWSSLGKNLWPKEDQINSGDVSLRKDGSGTDLSEYPGLMYQKQGDKEKALDTYYFRISAYNGYGETEPSEVTAVKMPDTTAPTVPENIKASDELISNFSLTWDPSFDKSPVEYNVKLTTESGNPVFTGTSQTNSITIPESYLTPRSTYNVLVKAVDKSNNQSNYSAPATVTARKKLDAQLIGVSSPASVQEAGSSPYVRIVLKNVGIDSWTRTGRFLLKADTFSTALAETDIIKTGDTKVFELRLPADMPLGTSQITWRMFNQNSGYFGDYSTMTVSFEDRMDPQISLVSPADNQRVNGKISLEGSITDFRLKKYSIYYGYGETPAEWITIKDGEGPAADLGEWKTTNLKNGTYKLRIEAEDLSGRKSTLERIVYVKNPVSNPAVQEITDQSTTITGTAKPGTTVLIFKNEGQLGSGPVSEDGIFSVPIPQQMPRTEIKIIAIDGYDGSDAVSVRVKDVTPSEQPMVNTVTNKAAVITGKTEPSAMVQLKLPDKTYSGKADTVGNFSIPIPIQNFGTTILITVQDGAQLKSIEKKILVSRTAPNIPTVNAVNNKAAVVSGKAEKGATIIVGISTRSYSAKADIYGNYKVDIPVQNSGIKLYITAKDAAGNSSTTASITVARVAPNIPLVNAVRYYSTTVTGKTERHVVVSVKIGTRVFSTKSDYYGNFKVSIPKQKKGTKLTVTAKDAKGKISVARTVTVY